MTIILDTQQQLRASAGVGLSVGIGVSAADAAPSRNTRGSGPAKSSTVEATPGRRPASISASQADLIQSGT